MSREPFGLNRSTTQNDSKTLEILLETRKIDNKN